MAGKVVLEVVAGPITGKVFSFEKHDTFVFGRHPNCHARLPKDRLVSRHHFLLEVNPPDARVRDLGSLNGTYVNGAKCGGRSQDQTPEDASSQRYPELDLTDGDHITAGHTTIQVKILLPVTCGQCGTEILDTERMHAESTHGGILCAACRDNPGAGRPIGTLLETIRCERCGKDVSPELRNGRRGDFLCEDCRADAMDEPGGLRRLLQEAARKRDKRSDLDIHGFEVGEELGRGGMGVVYRAVRTSDKEVVAVKIMLAKIAVDDNARNMFLREIDVVKRLRHPNIVTSLQSGSAGITFFFVMEYCNGGSLDKFIQRQGGKLPLPSAKPIMMQCLDGLGHAHALKFVHRDLKPQNVLLNKDSRGWVVKVSDFGLAKSFEMAGLSGMTATGSRAGTYQFMPREQLTEYKYVRPASDVWSIAATFYNMLTGAYPRDFPPDRDPMEVVLYDDAVPIREREPGISPSVAHVLDRALLSDPAKRYQNTDEMKTELQKAF